MGKLGDILAHPEELLPLVRARQPLHNNHLAFKLPGLVGEASNLLLGTGPHLCSKQESHEASGRPQTSILL